MHTSRRGLHAAHFDRIIQVTLHVGGAKRMPAGSSQDQMIAVLDVVDAIPTELAGPEAGCKLLLIERQTS
jgi:hypothetical protein